MKHLSTDLHACCWLPGCTGALAREVAKAFPSSSVTVFDLPHVVEMAQKHFAQDDDTIAFQAGECGTRTCVFVKPTTTLCLLKASSAAKTCRDRALSTAAPSLRNSLPISIRRCTDLPTFKSQLKTHLMILPQPVIFYCYSYVYLFFFYSLLLFIFMLLLLFSYLIFHVSDVFIFVKCL